MVCFIIALMNKEVASNWDKVELHFNNTLHSIFNQTDHNFRVYVGYTDMPTLYEPFDDRLVMIPCNTHTPVERIEKLRDRGWKLSACANAIYNDIGDISFEDGGVFVFPVDADDLVNKHIVEYANSHSEANGFKSRTAYRYQEGKKYMEITPYFGGSMNVMKLYKSDLIAKMPDTSLCFDYETSCTLHKCPVRWTDYEVERQFADLGRPLSYFPFKSTIYIIGTGDNLSESDPNNMKGKTKRFHPIAFLRRISPLNKQLITNRIKRDFGIRESR